MKFYLPDRYLEPQKTDFLLGIRDNNQEKNQELLDKILEEDETDLIFFDMDTDRLAPLQTPENIRYEYDDWTLWNLITLNIGKREIYYISGDFNINSNIRALQYEISERGIEIKNSIIPLVYGQTYGFNHIDYYEGKKYEINNHTLKIDDAKTWHDEPTYNVISLNCSRKFHRTDLIKALYKEEGFIHSYYPFEDEDQIDSFFDNEGEVELLKELTELNEIYDDSFKRNPKPLKDRTREELVKDLEIKHHSRQHSVPIEYVSSCIDLITEAYFMDSALLTEKAFKPIAYRKPFIILGPRNCHSLLEWMDFELYDELFDYSFDHLDYEERFNSIVTQIKKICKMPINELADKIKSMKEKIDYNFNLLQRIDRVDMYDWFREENTKSDYEIIEYHKKQNVLDIRR